MPGLCPACVCACTAVSATAALVVFRAGRQRRWWCAGFGCHVAAPTPWPGVVVFGCRGLRPCARRLLCPRVGCGQRRVPPLLVGFLLAVAAAGLLVSWCRGCQQSVACARLSRLPWLCHRFVGRGGVVAVMSLAGSGWRLPVAGCRRLRCQ